MAVPNEKDGEGTKQVEQESSSPSLGQVGSSKVLVGQDHRLGRVKRPVYMHEAAETASNGQRGRRIVLELRSKHLVSGVLE